MSGSGFDLNHGASPPPSLGFLGCLGLFDCGNCFPCSRRPLAKLHTSMTANAISHRENRGQAVVFDLALYLAGPLGCNYSITSNSCLPLKLALLTGLRAAALCGTP